MGATVENPEVRIGSQGGERAFEIHVDNSGTPAGFAVFIDSTDDDGVALRTFPHTVVRPEFGGRGLASQLIREAVEQSIAQGFMLVPACSFVDRWLQKHPEFSENVRH